MDTLSTPTDFVHELLSVGSHIVGWCKHRMLVGVGECVGVGGGVIYKNLHLGDGLLKLINCLKHERI